MATQKDMFDGSDSDAETRKKALRRVSSTLDNRRHHRYQYYWVILFNWDCNVSSPFFQHKLSEFNDTDIKKEWISGNLGLKSRMTKLNNLSPFPGGTYSLFSKIEIGEYII